MDSADLPAIELAFPGPARDSGVAAILAGRKTALTGLLQILEHAAEWRTAHEDFFRSEGVAKFLGAPPVIDDGTLVITERFCLVKADDTADH